jgi:hypothetical protein
LLLVVGVSLLVHVSGRSAKWLQKMKNGFKTA